MLWMRLCSSNINDIVETNGHDLCSALLGLHAFTGCDSNSSFMRKGKINPIKIMKKDNSFIQAFKRLGTSEDVNESDIDTFERFTCKLYGSKKKVEDLNTLRYTRFMSKNTRPRITLWYRLMLGWIWLLFHLANPHWFSILKEPIIKHLYGDMPI